LGKSNTTVGNNAVSTSSDKTTIGVNSLLSCTASNNSCLAYNAGSLITGGTGNICIGVGSASGTYDNTVSDNIGNGTSTTASGVLGSIILGNNASCSTGSREGTILEYDSSKNILPSV